MTGRLLSGRLTSGRNFPSLGLGWAFSQKLYEMGSSWIGENYASYGTSGQGLTILTWPHGLMRVVKGPFKAKVELRQVRPLVRI